MKDLKDIVRGKLKDMTRCSFFAINVAFVFCIYNISTFQECGKLRSDGKKVPDRGPRARSKETSKLGSTESRSISVCWIYIYIYI